MASLQRSQLCFWRHKRSDDHSLLYRCAHRCNRLLLLVLLVLLLLAPHSQRRFSSAQRVSSEQQIDKHSFLANNESSNPPPSSAPPDINQPADSQESLDSPPPPPSPAEAYAAHPNVAAVHDDIWKLPSDNSTYLELELKNGIKIFLTTQPDSTAGAFAISYETGFHTDPIKLQGLAHFHEHMVAMGTKQYPGSRSFLEFSELKGAYGNAETQSFVTMYWHFIDDEYVPELVKSELNAIQSELVLRKRDFPLLISLITVIVKRDHYAQKTGIGPEMLKERIAARGVEHVRAQLAVFQARECIANHTRIFLMFRQPPAYSTVAQIIDTFSDLPTHRATKLEEMKAYIEDAKLDPKEVEEALNEQVNEPFPRNEETAQHSPFNYSATGSEIRLANPAATNVEFSYTFPVEDFGANSFNGTAYFLSCLFRDMKRHLRYNGDRGTHLRTFVFGLDEFHDLKRTMVSIRFQTDQSKVDMDKVLQAGEAFFEFIGNAMRLPPAYLEEFVRDSTVNYKTDPTPPVPMVEMVVQQILRPPNRPIQEAIRQFTLPYQGWVWNHTYIMDSIKRTVTPEVVVLQISHDGFQKEALEHPDQWSTIRGWQVSCQAKPFSEELKSRFRQAYQRGFDGLSQQMVPHVFVPLISTKLKPRPAVQTPPGVPLMHSGPENVKKFLADAKSLNFPIDAKRFQFPEYLEVKVGEARRIELLHEQSSGLKLPTASLILAIDVPVSSASSMTEELLQVLLQYINVLAPNFRPPPTTAIVGLSGSSTHCIMFRFEGRSASVLGQFDLSLDTMSKVLQTGEAMFSEQAWKTALDYVKLVAKGQLGLVTTAVNYSHFLSLVTWHSASKEQTKPKEWKAQFVRALNVLRLALSASNPRLIVIGDVTRAEAEALAHKIGELLPFHNIPRWLLSQHRIAQWPGFPHRLVLMLNNTRPGVDLSFMTAVIQVPTRHVADCSDEVLKQILLIMLKRSVFMYYRNKRGMCYATDVLAIAQDRLSDREVFAVVVQSNSHTGLQLAQAYDDFKANLREHILTISDDELQAELKTSARKILTHLIMNRESWMTLKLFGSDFQLMKPFQCGLRSLEWRKDIPGLRSQLLTLYDTQWNTSSAASDNIDALKEAFIIIERSKELHKAMDQREAASKPEGVSKEARKQQKSAMRKPLICKSEEVCSWLIAQQKLNPSSTDETESETKKSYKSIINAAAKT